VTAEPLLATPAAPIAAALASLLLAGGSLSRAVPAMACAFADAAHHRSPNTGWPQVAMAGGPGAFGPRIDPSGPSNEPWLNGGARDPQAADIAAALRVHRLACGLLFVLIVVIAVAEALAWSATHLRMGLPADDAALARLEAVL
jgi:cobalamin biosynthesis protein CobD/CbiB